MNGMNEREQNQAAWDRRARTNGWYVDTAGDDDFLRPLAVADPSGWLGGNVIGRRILCLAAGGGRHGPLLAAAGARVTVVDLSEGMLARDREVAKARGLEVRTIQTSMDNLGSLKEERFDAVIQPVSTCYVPNVRRVFAQVADVLEPGGLYISQHKQPVSLQCGSFADGVGYPVRAQARHRGPLPPAAEDCWHREHGTVEFLHTLQDLLGGMCHAGFVIEDVMEPNHADPQAPPNTFPHRCLFVPPYLAIRARRCAGDSSVTDDAPALIVT